MYWLSNSSIYWLFNDHLITYSLVSIVIYTLLNFNLLLYIHLYLFPSLFVFYLFRISSFSYLLSSLFSILRSLIYHNSLIQYYFPWLLITRLSIKDYQLFTDYRLMDPLINTLFIPWLSTIHYSCSNYLISIIIHYVF